VELGAPGLQKSTQAAGSSAGTTGVRSSSSDEYDSNAVEKNVSATAEAIDGDERYMLSLGAEEGPLTEDEYSKWATDSAKSQGISVETNASDGSDGEALGASTGTPAAISKSKEGPSSSSKKDQTRREFIEAYRNAMTIGSGDVVAKMREIAERVRRKTEAANRVRDAIAFAGAAGVDGLPTAARVGANLGGGGLSDAQVGSYAAALAESPGNYRVAKPAHHRREAWGVAPAAKSTASIRQRTVGLAPAQTAISNRFAASDGTSRTSRPSIVSQVPAGQVKYRIGS